MRKVVIVSAARTAVGAFGGALKSFSAVDLGILSAKEAIRRANIDTNSIDEVIIGNVLGAGLGQNVARQISIGSDIPESVSAFTMNKLCGSGLRAVGLGSQIIRAGDADCVLAGGTESMSNAPYISKSSRWGIRMGNDTLVDSMLTDGLIDKFNDIHMGMTAENIAEKWNISREEQDEFAELSQSKAKSAIKSGRFKDEIVPIEVPQRKGDPIIFDTDEYPRETTLSALSKLKPVFKESGSVTSGNSSGLNDGAAMLVLMEEEKAKKMGLNILAEICACASAGVDPKIMGYGVVPASRKVAEKAGIDLNSIDLFELNEAFSAQALCVVRELGVDINKVNLNGGAVALGHPIGASGARILTTLLYEMIKRDSKTGLASLCIGGGMGTAMIIRRYS